MAMEEQKGGKKAALDQGVEMDVTDNQIVATSEIGKIIKLIALAPQEGSWQALSELCKNPLLISKEPEILKALNGWVTDNFASCKEEPLKSLFVDTLLGAAALLEPNLAMPLVKTIFENLSDWDDPLCLIHATTGTVQVLKNRRSATWSPDLTSFLQHIAEESLVNLHHPSPQVRAACLQILHIISQIAKGLTETPVVVSEADVFQLGMNFVEDSDSRVRFASCEVLEKCISATLCPDPAQYRRLCNLLDDSDVLVRLVAVDLVQKIASHESLQGAQVDHEGSKARIVNDAFLRICDLVNDWTIEVRQKASEVMGRFKGVETLLLRQTLSKQVLRPKKRQAPSQTSSGGQAKKKRKQGVDTSMSIGDQDLDEGELSLVEASSCGAFIHAMEDEFQEVRDAAINSLRLLCIENFEFAKASLDFLFDMLNDEADVVRLNAIDTLCTIADSHPGTRLDLDQLNTVLAVTLDHDAACRRSVFRFLGSIRMAGPASILTFVDILYVSLRRYPEDTEAIFQCMAKVGEHHPEIVLDLVGKLFRIDSRFLPQEIALQDLQHVSNVFLLFGACRVYPAKIATIPAYLRNHYEFISLRYPDLAPRIHDKEVPMDTDIEQQADSSTFVETVLAKFHLASLGISKGSSLAILLRNLHGITFDLETLAADEPSSRDACELLASHIKLCVGILKMREAFLAEMHENVQHEACVLLYSTYRIEQTFSLLSPEYGHVLRCVRALAHLFWAFGTIASRRPSSENAANILKRCSERMKRLQRRLARANAECFWQIPSLDTFADAESFVKWIKASVKVIPFPNLPTFDPQTRKATAKFETPGTATDAPPLEVVSAFPASIDVSLQVRNVQNTGDLFVEVTTPTGVRGRIHPPSAHYEKLPDSPKAAVLKTALPLKFEKWSGPAPVKLAVSIEFEPDQVTPDVMMVRSALGDRSTDVEKFCYLPVEVVGDGNVDFSSHSFATSQIRCITL